MSDPTPTSLIRRNLNKKDRGHKARMIMTMFVEGKDEPKRTSIELTSHKTDPKLEIRKK